MDKMIAYAEDFYNFQHIDDLNQLDLSKKMIKFPYEYDSFERILDILNKKISAQKVRER